MGWPWIGYINAFQASQQYDLLLQAAAVCSSLYIVDYKTNAIEQKQSGHSGAIFTCFMETNVRTWSQTLKLL